MACMGADQNYAFSQAEKALDEIKYLLMNKYKIDCFPDQNPYLYTSFVDEQTDNFKVLDGLIKEIFWNDGCASF